ncbi:hypothetical protein NMY22_g11529 [Coprinellus aureogranulatus]|nr:hypothetical protein NMY22_g11529 [Coprinellus aureogranulatus]
MSRRTAMVEEEFDDDTDLPLPSFIPNTGARGPLLQEIVGDDDSESEAEEQQAGPASPQRQSRFAPGPAETSTIQDITPYKTWTCIYPIYLDAKRPYGTGQRRVSRAKSLWWPQSKDISEASIRLGLPAIHEVNKSHPRDWENPGRVRVGWKKNGQLVNPNIKTKKQLLEMISLTIQHLKPENIPRPPYSLSSAPVDITAPSTTETQGDNATASSTAKGKQPATPKAAQASTPASKPTGKKPALPSGAEQKQQKPSRRPLPVPPTPYPPLSNRISQYSPALSTGVLIDTVKAGMNAAPVEGALPGMPGMPAGMGKGKRKVVRTIDAPTMNTRHVNRNQPRQTSILPPLDCDSSPEPERPTSPSSFPEYVDGLTAEELGIIDDDPDADILEGDAEQQDEGREQDTAPPVRRRRGRPRKNAASPTPASTPGPSTAPTTAKVVTIQYNLNIWSIAEQAKPKSKRKPQSRILDDIKSDSDFLDVKDSFKMEFVDVLFPGMALVPDTAYKLFYTINQRVPNEVPLATDQDYVKMVKLAQSMRNPLVKVAVYEQDIGKSCCHRRTELQSNLVELLLAQRMLVQPRNPATQEEDQDEGADCSEELPANIAIAENMAKLRVRWACNTPGCPSDFCYVPPDGKKHIRLTNDHQERWGAAMETGKAPIATLEIPPNHAMYLSDDGQMAKSAILQARLDAKAKEKATVAPAPAAPAQPIINVVLPNNLYGYAPGAPNPAQNVPAVPAAAAQTIAVNEDSLVPSGMLPGPKLPLDEFCARYGLPESVLDRFTLNGFRYTTGFRFMKVSELRELEFKPGEIVELRDAVEEWAVLPPA